MDHLRECLLDHATPITVSRLAVRAATDLRYVALRPLCRRERPRGLPRGSAGHEARAVAERHGGSRFPILSCTKTAQTDSGPPLGPQAKTRAVELAGPSTEQLHTCIWVKPVAAPSPDGRAVACERCRDGDRRPLPYPSRSVSARPVSSPRRTPYSPAQCYASEVGHSHRLPHSGEWLVPDMPRPDWRRWGVESRDAVETTNWDITARNLDGSSQVRPRAVPCGCCRFSPCHCRGRAHVTIEVGHTVAGTPVGL